MTVAYENDQTDNDTMVAAMANRRRPLCKRCYRERSLSDSAYNGCGGVGDEQAPHGWESYEEFSERPRWWCAMPWDVAPAACALGGFIATTFS
ncbi:hypothetical protein MRX96_045995 [Rhipicephalus microplus]